MLLQRPWLERPQEGRPVGPARPGLQGVGNSGTMPGSSTSLGMVTNEDHAVVGVAGERLSRESGSIGRER